MTILFSRKITLLSIGILIALQTRAQGGTQDEVAGINAVSTAVPFLRITPDARGGGMGDIGIATSPDATGTYYNASKLVFSEKKLGVALSYTPWLRNLGISDIFIANVGGYYKIDDLQAFHTSLKFFSLGNITFTDYLGNINGDFKPREFAVDAGYARKLSDKFSLGAAVRYIHSNLAAGQEVSSTEVKAGNAVGVDLTTTYMQNLKLKGNKKGVVSAGIALTNIGSKISYTEDAKNKDYIPTNLGLGIGFRLLPNDLNDIGFYTEFNKLLVPTPTTELDADGNFVYKQKSPIAGMFTSFGDAPGGFKEEMQEITYAFGVEYWYDKQFGVRTGYFHESAKKGNRKYFTAGVSVKYSVFGLDFSYLVPTSSQRSPLDNTFRFTLQFDFDKVGNKHQYTEEELKDIDITK